MTETGCHEAGILWKWMNAFTAFSSLIQQPPCCLKILTIFLKPLWAEFSLSYLYLFPALNGSVYFNTTVLQNSATESIWSWTKLWLWRTILCMADTGGLGNLSNTTWVKLVYAVLHPLHVLVAFFFFFSSYHIWKKIFLVVFKSFPRPCLTHFLPGAVFLWKNVFLFSPLQVTILWYPCHFTNVEGLGLGLLWSQVQLWFLWELNPTCKTLTDFAILKLVVRKFYTKEGLLWSCLY